MAWLEIEMKFRAADHAALKAKLATMGAVRQGEHLERDFYFNAPDRDFARTNEAFRIRQIGNDSHLTYKGPRQAGPTKTREEIEVPLHVGVEASAQAAKLFERLGYRRVALVEKQREQWHCQQSGYDVTVCFDSVKDVGEFVEVEIVAEENDKALAEATVLGFSRELGLTDIEPRSYLRMFLERPAP